MRWLTLLLLLGCNRSHGPDPEEVKLRDTSINALRTCLARCRHPSNKFECGDSASLAKATCNKEHLDQIMQSKQLEQEILAECAKDLPEIEALPKQ